MHLERLFVRNQTCQKISILEAVASVTEVSNYEVILCGNLSCCGKNERILRSQATQKSYFFLKKACCSGTTAVSMHSTFLNIECGPVLLQN